MPVALWERRQLRRPEKNNVANIGLKKNEFSPVFHDSSVGCESHASEANLFYLPKSYTSKDHQVLHKERSLSLRCIGVLTPEELYLGKDVISLLQQTRVCSVLHFSGGGLLIVPPCHWDGSCACSAQPAAPTLVALSYREFICNSVCIVEFRLRSALLKGPN